jgi:hypothetical protein
VSNKTEALVLEVLLCLLIAVIIISPFAILIGLMVWDAHVTCDIYAETNPDFDVMWVKRHGCMVKYNGLYVKVDDVINVLGLGR